MPVTPVRFMLEVRINMQILKTINRSFASIINNKIIVRIVIVGSHIIPATIPRIDNRIG